MEISTKARYYILTIGMLINISSFIGILNLQSSINIQKNLGTTSISVLYLTTVLLCVFAVPLCLTCMGAKWSFVIGEASFLAYSAANFHPALYTMIPGALISSLGEALVWPSSPIYINFLIEEMWQNQASTHESGSAKNEKCLEYYKHKWFGYFYSVLKACQIVGNILSYAVLYGGRNLNVSVENLTDKIHNISHCGSRFCKVDETIGSINRYVPTSTLSVYIMLAAYMVMQLLPVIVHSIYLPNIQTSSQTGCTNTNLLFLFKQTVLNTFKHIFSCAALLLTPIYFYYGFLISYTFSEFTKAFVSCTIGVQQVGLVMTLYGVTNCLFALVVSFIAKRFGLTCLYVAGLLYDCLNWTIQLYWVPKYRYSVYALGGMLGISDGIWQPIIVSTVVLFFNDQSELAFGVYQLWTAFGIFLGSTISGNLCASVQVYLRIFVVVIGCFGYFIANYLRRKALNNVKHNGGTALKTATNYEHLKD